MSIIYHCDYQPSSIVLVQLTTMVRANKCCYEPMCSGYNYGLYGQPWSPWYNRQYYNPIAYGRPYSPYFGFPNSPVMMSPVQSGPSSFGVV
ncbi:hypothetical protein BLOT_008371 [Blomia tropicalis]|nr:hypothetical protein BLOT_008371 [Blomia tropicalis]